MSDTELIAFEKPRKKKEYIKKNTKHQGQGAFVPLNTINKKTNENSNRTI